MNAAFVVHKPGSITRCYAAACICRQQHVTMCRVRERHVATVR